MYVAMNHFLVASGRGDEFEERWRSRESFLAGVAGFVSFHLLRGDDDGDGNHRYASHTLWETREAFLKWTESEAFRNAHAQGGVTKGLLLGPPRFAGWESVDL